MDSPKTLQAAILYYADPKNCIAEMVAQRWPDGKVICPACGRNDVTWQEKAQRFQCKSQHPKRKFSVKVGTIYEDSPLGLDKWLMATWMISNCKNGVSSYEIARAIGVTQKSAWFMLHRIRVAMGEDDGKLGGNGPVEMDETFVGGKVKNMHKAKIDRKVNYKGGQGKAVVVGMLERGGRVRAKVVANRQKAVLDSIATGNVEAGSHLITDQYNVYPHLDTAYFHEVVNHAVEYVNGHVHTNGIENFWSLLKRGLGGTYISVEPAHLQSYVEEQVFRYNYRRDIDDFGRFTKVMSQIVGKRLTYAALTERVDQTAF